MDIILKTFFTEKDIARFWSRADKSNDCWIWSRAISKDGYGKFSLKRQEKTLTFRAHRVAFFLHYGKIDASLLICHTCDNRKCVNPSHLFQGSVLANTRDMISKGRSNKARGMKLSTLTDEQVLSIRERVKNGEKQRALSRELKLGKNQIWHIVNGTTWRHLKLTPTIKQV